MTGENENQYYNARTLLKTMSKIGFIQDLIRGVKKVVRTNEPQTTAKETVVVNTGNANVEPLLRRAFLFLEDGDWQKADEFCEQVLNHEPENAEAYLGKLMAELHVHCLEELQNQEKPFDENNNYKKVLRFCKNDLASTLEGYNAQIKENIEKEYLEKIYSYACHIMNKSKNEEDFETAASKFRSISGYLDADLLAAKCDESAAEYHNESIYDEAKKLMETNRIGSYEIAIKKLETISGWRDVDELIIECQRAIKKNRHLLVETSIENEKLKKKKKKMIISLILSIIFVLVIVLVCLFIRYHEIILWAVEYYF